MVRRSKTRIRAMPSQLTLLFGDAGTGKTERLLKEYRAALRSGRERKRPGTVLWLAPTRRVQQVIVERLLNTDEPVQLAPRVLTFDVFAEQVLAAGGKPATPISPVMKRLLLRRIVADLSSREQLVNFSSVTQTTGFLDVVSSFISELKREEIWPDEFLEACSHRPPKRAKRDRELGLIYSKYQLHLSRQNWYDNEGRFWLARTALADGVRGPFSTVEFLAVDGFADFTQTQYEILGHLMSWIPRATVTLPYEDPPTRPELFDKPRTTIDRLRKCLPAGTRFHTENMAADRSTWPAGMRVVAQSLFSNPRAVTPSPDAAGLELVAATGPLGECQAVALRIKRLVIEGISPSRIVVAVRSVMESGPAWRDYFEQAGIPTWCEAGTPLASSPIVKALFSVLQLELEDWPFSRLTQVLGSNYFQPTWPELSRGRGTRLVGAALRRLKLHAGRELMMRVLARVGAGAIVDEETGEEFTGDTQATVAALAKRAEAILKRLSLIMDRLRKKCSLTDWGDVIASLGRDLGWQTSDAVPPGTTVSNDARDWDLLQGIIRTAGEAERKLVLSADTKSVKQLRLDLAGFTAELRDLLGGEQIKAAGDPGGCVRIMDVEQARHLDVPYLFVVGLAESSFPLNRGDDCLFGEVERQEFARRGLPLQHREQHQRDEMFLFYSVVTRARTHLTLTYPAVNSKGQPVFASPYLVALRSLFDEHALKVYHEGQLDPVPTSQRAMTESDLRLLAISEGRSGHPGLFSKLAERPGWLATGHNILASIDVNAARFHERGFTRYEGRLESPQNLSSLWQRFGTRHQFSATELEAYATCPFRFWVNSVLKVDDLVTPEEGTDYAARGSLVHVVLAQMLREGLDLPEERLAERFHELVQDHLARRFHETELQRALTSIEERLLTEWGRAFARQQINYAAQLHEVWTGGVSALPPEIPFGNPGGRVAGEEATDPLVFGSGNAIVSVRGRIDRVDTGFAAGRRVFNVIDYKTGNPPRSTENDLRAGRSLQLALYALAIRRLGIAGVDAESYQMGYWSLKATGFKRGYQRDSKTLVAMPPDLVSSLEQAMDEVIPKLARGIRDGKFLVENSDENCTGYCPLHTSCRVNQIRPLTQSLNKIGDILGYPSDNSQNIESQPDPGDESRG